MDDAIPLRYPVGAASREAADPDQRQTRPSKWWRWLVIGVTVMAAIVCGVILWTFVPPTVFFPIFAFASWVLLILGFVWLVLAIIGWVKFRAWKLPSVAIVVVLATLVMVMFSVPSRTAFVVSKSSLSDVATECSRSFETERVGAYVVRYVQPVDGGCLIYVDGGLIDSVGFAYLPDSSPYLGKPRRDGDIGYSELEGDWYTFVQRF